jgi:hypothetical protein
MLSKLLPLRSVDYGTFVLKQRYQYRFSCFRCETIASTTARGSFYIRPRPEHKGTHAEAMQ